MNDINHQCEVCGHKWKGQIGAFTVNCPKCRISGYHEPPPAEPPTKIKMGFLIRVEAHGDAIGKMFHPEKLQHLVGAMLERESGQMIQEGVDFSLEVSRTYENE